jgi:hypothetical protein
MTERIVMTARTGSTGRVSRRAFVQGMGAAGGALLAGWHNLLLASAPELRKEGRSVIVLWMRGGPSQFETFDPKPGDDAVDVVNTAVPGVSIAEFWPNIAKQMKDLVVIRSMTSKEGNHQRATYQMHTGYLPTGSLRHPSLGSLVAREIGPDDADLPSAYAPFRVADPNRMPDNAVTPVSASRFDRRLALLTSLEQSYAGSGARKKVEDHQSLYERASKLVKSPKLSAFDIDEEPKEVREAYGEGRFARGCLLARRLIESKSSSATGTRTRITTSGAPTWPASAISRSPHCSRT